MYPRSKNKNISKSSIIFAKIQNLLSFPSQKCGPKNPLKESQVFNMRSSETSFTKICFH